MHLISERPRRWLWIRLWGNRSQPGPCSIVSSNSPYTARCSMSPNDFECKWPDSCKLMQHSARRRQPIERTASAQPAPSPMIELEEYFLFDNKKQNDFSHTCSCESWYWWRYITDIIKLGNLNENVRMHSRNDGLYHQSGKIAITIIFDHESLISLRRWECEEIDKLSNFAIFSKNLMVG